MAGLVKRIARRTKQHPRRPRLTRITLFWVNGVSIGQVSGVRLVSEQHGIVSLGPGLITLTSATALAEPNELKEG